jgi:hypothetical protein
VLKWIEIHFRNTFFPISLTELILSGSHQRLSARHLGIYVYTAHHTPGTLLGVGVACRT